ncbi:MAG: hypothetical protein ABR523_01020, partial [Desulfurivibrionaceae bacterium]
PSFWVYLSIINLVVALHLHRSRMLTDSGSNMPDRWGYFMKKLSIAVNSAPGRAQGPSGYGFSRVELPGNIRVNC